MGMNKFKVLYISNIEVPYRTKFFNLLGEKCDLISEKDTGEPILIDFTALSDEEMSELIREAALCVEFENEFMASGLDTAERPHLLS